MYSFNFIDIVFAPPKKGDFGDQSYPLRILRCKTKLALNTCPGLKIYDFGDYREFINNTNGIVTRPPPLIIGDFGDHTYPLRILRCKTNFDLNTCTSLKISDFGDYREIINSTNGIVTRSRPPPLKLGDFGDQSYLLRILSLIKINFELNT